MLSPLERKRILQLIVCASQVLAIGSLIHAQHATSPSERAQGAQQVSFNNFAYQTFIEHLGQEDDHLQSALEDGAAQPAGRMDYAKALGIDTREEQAMLAILLEAYRKDKEVDGRWGCHSGERVNDLNRRYGYEIASKMIQAEEEVCTNEKLQIVQEAWFKLRDALASKSFKKLDRSIAGRRWIPDPGKTAGPDPCPPNFNPPPGQTTHLACVRWYEDFFLDFGRTDLWNHKLVAEGTNGVAQDFNTGIPLPEDKKQAVIDLGLDTARAINGIDEKANKLADPESAKYDAESHRYVIPPEVEELGKRRGEIIEGSITKLRQVLGEPLFGMFDGMLSGQNKSIQMPIDSPSPTVRSSRPECNREEEDICASDRYYVSFLWSCEDCRCSSVGSIRVQGRPRQLGNSLL